MRVRAWGKSLKRSRIAVALTAACALALMAGPAATQAAVPFKDITSSGPLEHIYLGNELSCQVKLTQDTDLSFYPEDTIPGDCGTILSTGGVQYSPDWSNHDGNAVGGGADGTPFTPVSQTNVTGAGTNANPFKVITVVDAGTTGLRITQTDTYVTGNVLYRSQIVVSNPAPLGRVAAPPPSVVLYHAGDCFLNESDDGYGFYDSSTGGIFCAVNPNNDPLGRIIGFVPLSSGSNYMESRYSTVWNALNGSALPDTVEPTVLQDNGAGLSWSFTVPQGSSVTRSMNTVIDVTGRGGPVGECKGTNATIVDGPGGNTIIGTKGNDVIQAYGGDDVIKGLEGDDLICSGPGKDQSYGGPGKDRVLGGRGRDHLYGGSGNDRLIGGEAGDFLFGGAGDDRLFGGTPGAPPQDAIDKCVGNGGDDQKKNCERGSG